MMLSRAPRTQLFISPVGTVRHGSNLKETKDRIKSVQSIQKITKTMKMIASARLKGAQTRMEQARPFGDSATSTLNRIQNLEEKSPKSNNLFVALSTDRGLCGSINSQIVRTTRSFVDNEENGQSTMAILGDKAASQLIRTHADKISLSVVDLSKGGNNFFAVSVIADKLLSSETAADLDNIYVLYNKFNSVISFTPTLRHVATSKTMARKVEEGMAELDDFEFEDDFKLDHLGDLAQFHLASTMYTGVLENQASELGARMTSMDTATTNAGDMIKRLTIQYNRGRQASITTELNEIISGAEALKTEQKAKKEFVVPIDSVREVLQYFKSQH